MKTRNESKSEEQEHIDDGDNMMVVTRGREWGQGMGVGRREVGRSKEGAISFCFYIRLLRGRKRGRTGRKFRESLQTHPPSGSHPKNLEWDFLDGAFVGAGLLKP
jgi:hypothetical protein